MSDFDLTIEDIDLIFDDVPAHKKVAVEKKVDELMWAATERFKQEFIRPTIKYDLRGTTAGWAQRRGELFYIRLNTELLNNGHWDEMLNRTLPHEMAHIIVMQLKPGAKPHGKEWQAVMRMCFGLSPDRCHNYEVTQVRKKSRPYAYHCSCRTHMLTITRHRRIQQGSTYYCKYCKGVIERGEE